jgi:hypothetical protein
MQMAGIVRKKVVKYSEVLQGNKSQILKVKQKWYIFAYILLCLNACKI